MAKSPLKIKSLYELIDYLETRKELFQRQYRGAGFSYEAGAIYALEEALRAVKAFKESIEQETLERARLNKTST